MASNRAPKQWQLTTSETLNSFKNWKENLCYTLSLDPAFKPFLSENVTWKKSTDPAPCRGFTDTAATGTTAAVTKEAKCSTLNLMLGQIANYATVISRNQIIKNSTSLTDIWEKIRQHYGFHSTGSRFLDLSGIKLQAGQRAEDLYQSLVSFFDDNLLTTDSKIVHHTSAVSSDEEVTPTLENTIVFLWLERIHVSLPSLVKQRYGAELRNKTLATIKPEISQALDSLLEELSAGEDSRICRTQSHDNRRRQQPSNSSRSNKYCCLCRTANRPGHDTHFLSQCRFLPEADRKRMAASSSRIRNVEVVQSDDFEEDNDYENYEGDEVEVPDNRTITTNNNNLFIDTPIHRRVTTRKSPRMRCFFAHIPLTLCIDTGAESNLIQEKTVILMGLKICPTTQGANQADMKTPLSVIGEISEVKINKGSHVFILDALVVRDEIGDDIVAGEPFLYRNDIAVRPARREIIIKGSQVISYASQL